MAANGNGNGHFRDLNATEWTALIERETQEFFGLSAAEFARRLQAGDFDDEDAYPEAARIAMLLPSGR